MDALDHHELWDELEALRREGKVLHVGVALGPKIGWREEGLRAIAERPIAALQGVYNLLEQDPGAEFNAAAEEKGVGVIARVPTSSGLLEGHLTPDTTFTGSDHRRHRPREWLIDGLEKVERLAFLARDGERTLAQAAMTWILAQPGIGCVVHTVNTAAPAARSGRRPAATRCPTSTPTSWRGSTPCTARASGWPSARRALARAPDGSCVTALSG